MTVKIINYQWQQERNGGRKNKCSCNVGQPEQKHQKLCLLICVMVWKRSQKKCFYTEVMSGVSYLGSEVLGKDV